MVNMDFIVDDVGKMTHTSSPMTVKASEANLAATSSGDDATSFKACIAPISWNGETLVTHVLAGSDTR